MIVCADCFRPFLDFLLISLFCFLFSLRVSKRTAKFIEYLRCSIVCVCRAILGCEWYNSVLSSYLHGTQSLTGVFKIFVDSSRSLVNCIRIIASRWVSLKSYKDKLFYIVHYTKNVNFRVGQHARLRLPALKTVTSHFFLNHILLVYACYGWQCLYGTDLNWSVTF